MAEPRRMACSSGQGGCGGGAAGDKGEGVGSVGRTVGAAGAGLVAGVVIMLALPAPVRAAGGGVSASGARASALADSTTARGGGAEALASNPASMGALRGPTLSVSAQAGRLDMRFARHRSVGDGRAPDDLGRDVSGFTAAFGAPLIGPFLLGGVVYLPAGHLLRIRASDRIDEPVAPLYGDRLDHVAATVGAAASLGGWGGIGVAVTLSPDLKAPTVVRYEPGRGETVDDNVVLHIDRELNVRASLVVGGRLIVAPGWALGAAWRDPVTSRAFGKNDTEAGSLAVRDSIDFFEFFSPEEFAAGVQAPLAGGSVSADAVLARWSEYRTIHNEAPERSFEDVVALRAGGEWDLGGLALRVGYGFEPSPVPAQTGDTNYLDADRHVLAGGLGVRPVTGLAVDIHMRTHVLADQRVDKAPTDGPITNLGHPGWTAQGAWWDAGLTVTLR